MAMILQIILMLGTPWVALQINRRNKLSSWLNPVIICYGVGILIGQWSFGANFSATATWTRDIFLLLGIPLLLYSTNLKLWFQQARSTTISFLACVITAFICSVLSAVFIFPEQEGNWYLAGMLTGLYSGGIPNLNAVGRGLGAPDELLIYGNTADIILGGAFLLFLTSVARPFYAWILKDPSPPEIKNLADTHLADHPDNPAGILHKDNWKALLLSILIAGLAAGGTILITGHLETISVLLLLLTSLSIGASFWPVVQTWRGSFDLGEYFLLIFCVALGMLADFSNIISEGVEVIRFMAIVLFSIVLIHLLISRLFKIDADTSILMATAALYGPVFIPQVAAAIGNRKLIFAGIAMGLIGYALGNYLGLGAGYLTRYLLM